MYQSTNVEIYQRVKVPECGSMIVLKSKYTKVQTYQSTNILTYKCTKVQMY